MDALAAEHFKLAHRITPVFSSLLFNAFILHGYLPADFMRTAMVPIINRNKTGDTSDIIIIIDPLHLLLQHLSCFFMFWRLTYT